LAEFYRPHVFIDHMFFLPLIKNVRFRQVKFRMLASQLASYMLRSWLFQSWAQRIKRLKLFVCWHSLWRRFSILDWWQVCRGLWFSWGIV